MGAGDGSGVRGRVDHTLRYDLNAKLPEGGKQQDVPAMLHALLIERFQLVFHYETKKMPVLALVVAKGWAKVKPATGKYTGWSVLDMTGLEGEYDMELKWEPEDSNAEFRRGA